MFVPSLIVSLSGSVVTAAPTQRAPLDTFRYEITPSATVDGPARDLDVRLSFRVGPSGYARLVLPSEWGGERDLYRAIVGLAVVTPDAKLDATSQRHLVTLRAARAGTVTVRYRIHQDWTGPIRRPEYHRAIASRDFAMLIGQNSLVIPERDVGEPVLVRIAWRALPADWHAASSFGVGPSISTATTVGNLRDALLIAGAIEWRQSMVGGRPLVLGSVGRSAIHDSTFARLAATLLDRERRFWSDTGPPSFLAVRVAISGGLGGTAFTNAVAMYADSSSSLSAFGRTFAHELFHLWNGRRLHLTGPEGSGKWFTEGVTDFYADRISEAAGILDSGEYLVRANRAIRDYYLSPVRNTPRDSVGRTYWTDPDMNRLPYLQGYLLSAHLDATTRAATGGRVTFDSVLARLLRAAPRDGALTVERIVAPFPAAARQAVSAAIASFIVGGRTIPVESAGFGPCLAVQEQQQYLPRSNQPVAVPLLTPAPCRPASPRPRGS